MSEKNDPRRIQAELIEKRVKQLEVQLVENHRNLGDAELKIVRGAEDDTESKRSYELFKEHGQTLQQKHDFLRKNLDLLQSRVENDDPTAVPSLETDGEIFQADETTRSLNDDTAHMDTPPMADHSMDFNNRFIVHNPQIKWNNSIRNIILRYIHQNSQRRGYVYYMSRRAVKFILDVLDDQKKADTENHKRRESFTTPQTPLSPDADDETTVQDRIEALLQDGRDIVSVVDDVKKLHLVVQLHQVDAAVGAQLGIVLNGVAQVQAGGQGVAGLIAGGHGKHRRPQGRGGGLPAVGSSVARVGAYPVGQREFVER